MASQDEDQLIPVESAIPGKYLSIFNFSHFNQMQSIVLKQLLETNENIVVAAPTGGGKTVIHELAIIHFLTTAPKKSLKCVFLAPNKALCQQRLAEWSRTFGSLGYSVLEVTGDSNMKQSLQYIAKASIIITTPEKWDSLTRSWRQHVFLLGAVDLLLVDEIHHLGESRGATLEALVVRMRMLSRAYHEKCHEIQSKSNDFDSETSTRSLRVIALSATLPNLADIGLWLDCKPQYIHFFDESFRPVPLRTYTLSYGNCRNTFLFERSLDERVPEVIHNYSSNKQTLVFCSSKNSCEVLSEKLVSSVRNLPTISSSLIQESRNEALTIQDTKLRGLAMRRVAYHHSGLPPDDRALIEKLYLNGYIHVLCATSTLAYGVNLPAHLVIIKGTNMWRGSGQGFQRTCHSNIIQMLGRAGRPGFDDFGVAVIMTSNEDKQFYESMSLSADIVESTLRENLTEAICAETTQKVITSLGDCLDWLKSTFFFVRLRKNPAHYGFQQPKSPEELDDLVQSVCSKSVNDLSREGLVSFDEETGLIEAFPEAHIMTRNIIKFETMVHLMRLPSSSNLKTVLLQLCDCDELLKPLRRQDKKFLNLLMRSLRFPLKDKVQTPQLKTYVLLQSAVTKVTFVDFSLRVEQAEVVEKSLRLLSALKDLSIHKLFGALLVSSLLLERALFTQLWEVSFGSIFFQCPGLSENVKKGLVERNLRTYSDVEGCSIKQIERLAACGQFEAQHIQNFARICKYSKLKASSMIIGGGEFSKLEILVNYFFEERNPNWKEEILFSGNFPNYELVCYSVETSLLICHRKIPFETSFPLRISVPCPRDISSLNQIQIYLISSIVGLDFISNPGLFTQSNSPTPTSTSTLSTPKNEILDQDSDEDEIGGELATEKPLSKKSRSTSSSTANSNRSKPKQKKGKTPTPTLMDFGYFNLREEQPASLPLSPPNLPAFQSPTPKKMIVSPPPPAPRYTRSELVHSGAIQLEQDSFSQDLQENEQFDSSRQHFSRDEIRPEAKMIIRHPNPEIIMLRQKASELQLNNLKLLNRKRPPPHSPRSFTQDEIMLQGPPTRELPSRRESSPVRSPRYQQRNTPFHSFQFFDEESEFEPIPLNLQQNTQPRDFPSPFPTSSTSPFKDDRSFPRKSEWDPIQFSARSQRKTQSSQSSFLKEKNPNQELEKKFSFEPESPPSRFQIPRPSEPTPPLRKEKKSFVQEPSSEKKDSHKPSQYDQSFDDIFF